MSHFKNEYLKRVAEIEKYYLFLKGIDAVETHKTSRITASNSVIKIDRELQKILRSYTFLLLYNLVESTLTNGIQEIYDHIHDDKISFNSLSKDFKEIWLNIRSKKLSLQSNETKIQSFLNTVISECNDLNTVNFENHRLTISGNLDFKTIEKIRSKYDFKGPIPNRDKRQLSTFLSLIKSKRNYLAHGNESFSKASELKTYSELELIKNELTIYLESIVKTIEELLKEKKFSNPQKK